MQGLGNIGAGFLVMALHIPVNGCYKTTLQGNFDTQLDVETADPVELDSGPETGPDAACPDNDGDGFRDMACGGNDCDDSRRDVFPGADEVCLDGIDNDCDGIIDGPLLLSDDLLLSTSGGSADSPILLWTGSEFVAVWPHDGTDGPQVRLARVPASGDRVERETSVLQGDIIEAEPSLAWTGSELGFAWERWEDEYPEIYFTLLSAAGDRLAGDVRVTFDAWLSVDPNLAWTGSEFAVAWVDTRLTESPCTMMGCAYDIFFARISARGEKIGEDIRVSDRAVSGRGNWGPVWTCWTGSEIGIFWNMFSRLGPDGSEVGADLDLGHYLEELPVWTGTEYGLLWASMESDPVDQQGVYFVRRGDDGEARGRALLEPAEYSSDSFSLAWAAGRFGAIWYSSQESGGAIHFRSLTADGEPQGTTLRVAGTLAHISHHALAWTGSEFGVAWSQHRDSSVNAFFNRIGLCD